MVLSLSKSGSSIALSEVPKIAEFRRAVDRIDDKRDSLLIKCLYLPANRVSETITKVCPWELKHKQTKPYGLHFSYSFEEHEKLKVLLLKYAVAKRKRKSIKEGKEVSSLVFKYIALPCDPKFEPWIMDLLLLLKNRGSLTFDLTRQTVNNIVKRRLRSLDDRIHSHQLRHYRITHLVTEYAFDPYDITAYSGWTFKTTFGQMGMGSGQLDIYLHMAWRKYFPKLLKKI